MVGAPGASWHLKSVDGPVAHDETSPRPEDLLVLYLGQEPEPAMGA